jgi:hypothetical protein
MLQNMTQAGWVMAANPWFRLYAEFASDAKVQMMSEALQRRYMMLMCLRCSGELVTLHETLHETDRDAAIAFLLRISPEDLAETKRVFMAKGFIGDDWQLTNWDKRQFHSDSSAARVARHRAKKKHAAKPPCNVTGTVTETKSNALDTDTDTDTDPSLRDGLDARETPPAAAAEAELSAKPKQRRANFQDLLTRELLPAYERIFVAAGGPPISSMTLNRTLKLEQFMARFGLDAGGWEDYLTCIAQNCRWMFQRRRRRDGSGTMPPWGFDQITTDECFLNVAEGRYDEGDPAA